MIGSLLSIILGLKISLCVSGIITFSTLNISVAGSYKLL